MWSISAFILSLTFLGERSWANPSQAYNVWSKQGEQGEEFSQLVKIDHGELSEILLQELEQANSVDLAFDVFDGTLTCSLQHSAVMHPTLAAKYPTVLAIAGPCDDNGSSVYISINTDIQGSFAATIHHQAGYLFFVDYDADKSSDISFLHLHVPVRDPSGWSDVVEFVGEEGRALLERKSSFFTQEQRRLATTEAYKFRLALVTTSTYSLFHGNTKASVLTAVNTAMGRVNGILLRELAVMFELIPNTDDLFCLDGDTDCDHLNNDSGILDQTEAFMSARGVESEDYDIGHSFTTQPGGVATVGSLCSDTTKHRGTSGYGSTPTGDDYYLLITHEFGHQLYGGHTFRDCSGPSDSSLSNSTAVEPGSGSSILSYSGVCDSENNLQYITDPYFNSKVLVTMRAFVEWRVGLGCGETVDLTDAVQPVMSTMDQCTVPKGNYVQLGGSIENEGDISGSVFTSWDRIDAGYEDFTDTSVARFAPREPSTRSKLRFLPNMYILSYDPVQLEEIAPLDGGGDQQMEFRFIGRTAYHRTQEITTFDAALAGTFGYYDLILDFDDSLQPLEITNPPASLQGRDTVEITWQGGTSDDVEILVALNTMVEVADPDFDTVVEDLDFVSMGVFSNTGSANVEIPQISNPSDLPMNLMVRSGDTECYFFDLAAGISYTSSSDPTATPSAQPSTSPSLVPSFSPSIKPSGVPSLSPTMKPSSLPSAAPSSLPSSNPSLQPSTLPSASPTPLPSANPSLAPTRDGTAAPTQTPQPTEVPSNAPSTQPSSAPSIEPTLTPSGSPSILPSVVPSRSPSTLPSISPSSSPTDSPSHIPSTSPTASPSSTPTTSPSQSLLPTYGPSATPTFSPTIAVTEPASCAARTENVCGYTKGRDGNPEVGFVSVCIRDRWGNLESQCISVDTLEELGEGDKLDRRQTIQNCGCCEDDSADSLGICRPNSCPVEEFGCGYSWNDKCGEITYKVKYCVKTRGRVKVWCADPFKDLKSTQTITGCGSECIEWNDSEEPTSAPTLSVAPSSLPTDEPTEEPSLMPSQTPTQDPSSIPTPVPSNEPTQVPSAQPSTSASPSSPPEPTAMPSSEPTPNPTTTPTDSGDATCASNLDNVCGYTEDFRGGVAPGYFSACLYDTRRRSYSTRCLPIDDYGSYEAGDRISWRFRLDSCGCCDSDASQYDYCVNDAGFSECPIEDYSCDLSGDKVGVQICYRRNGRLKKKCADPFEPLNPRYEVLTGCGRRCESPESMVI